MLGGNERPYTFLNKPAAKSCRSVVVRMTFSYHQALQGKYTQSKSLSIINTAKTASWKSFFTEKIYIKDLQHEH